MESHLIIVRQRGTVGGGAGGGWAGPGRRPARAGSRLVVG